MKKNFLSIVLCATLAFASVISANAALTPTEKKFEVLEDECFIPNNTIKMFGYNIDPKHSASFSYKGDSDYTFYLKDTVTNDLTASLNKGEKYAQSLYLDGTSCTSTADYKFDNTGGNYKKVRIKLSDFSSSFNEDGSHTKSFFGSEPFNYSFNPQKDANGRNYFSMLIIKSGAAHNAVSPDENGEIELYISLNPKSSTSFYTLFSSPFGSGGGISGNLKGLVFGDVNQSGQVDVSDVTHIQLALSGNADYTKIGKYFADFNRDNIHDIKDVTALQLALVEKD